MDIERIKKMIFGLFQGLTEPESLLRLTLVVIILAGQKKYFETLPEIGKGFEIIPHLIKSGRRIFNFGRTAGLFPAVLPKLLSSKQITIVERQREATMNLEVCYIKLPITNFGH